MKSEPETDAGSLIGAMMSSDFSSSGESWQEEMQKEQEQVDFHIPVPDDSGNYDSPALKKLRETWEGYFAKQINEDQVRDVLDEIYSKIEEQQDFMAVSVEEAGDSEEEPVNQDIYEGFEQHKQALEIMSEFFEKKDKTLIDKGMKLAQEATNLLMDGFNRYRKALEIAMTVFCPHCSAPNLKGSEKCHKCGSPLPVEMDKTTPMPGEVLAEEGEGGGAQFLTTPNYDRVMDAVNSWKNRMIEEDELKSELEAILEKFLDHLNDVQREKKDTAGLKPDEKKVFAELSDMIESALLENIEIIKGMLEFFVDRKPAHIDRGVEALFDATQKIIKAYQMTEQVNAHITKQTGEPEPQEEEEED